MFFPDDILDFHHLGILTPEQISYEADKFINNSHQSGHQFIRIITGKGRVVRPTVIRVLRQHRLIKDFKQAGYYEGQDGAYDIKLDIKNS